MKQSRLYLKYEAADNTPYGRWHNTRTRWFRHSKSYISSIDEDDANYSLHPKTKYSKKDRDYHYYNWDPLFNVLLKSVGMQWDTVWKSVYPRVSNMYEPIMSMVANCKKNGLVNGNVDISGQRPYFIWGEGSYWSKLYVDEDGILQYIDKNYVPSIQCGDEWGQSFNGHSIQPKAK